MSRALTRKCRLFDRQVLAEKVDLPYVPNQKKPVKKTNATLKTGSGQRERVSNCPFIDAEADCSSDEDEGHPEDVDNIRAIEGLIDDDSEIDECGPSFYHQLDAEVCVIQSG